MKMFMSKQTVSKLLAVNLPNCPNLIALNLLTILVRDMALKPPNPSFTAIRSWHTHDSHVAPPGAAVCLLAHFHVPLPELDPTSIYQIRPAAFSTIHKWSSACNTLLNPIKRVATISVGKAHVIKHDITGGWGYSSAQERKDRRREGERRGRKGRRGKGNRERDHEAYVSHQEQLLCFLCGLWSLVLTALHTDTFYSTTAGPCLPGPATQYNI